MPNVVVVVNHSVPVDEAVEKCKPMLTKVIESFQGTDPLVTWNENIAAFDFKSLGFKISGTATVEADKATVSVSLPIAAMLFKNKVEEGVKKGLMKALLNDES